MTIATESDLNHLKAWLMTKDLGETYPFWQRRDCLLASYLKESGFTNVDVDTTYFSTSGVRNRQIPLPVQRIANTEPWTHSDALRRTEIELGKLHY